MKYISVIILIFSLVIVESKQYIAFIKSDNGYLDIQGAGTLSNKEFIISLMNNANINSIIVVPFDEYINRQLPDYIYQKKKNKEYYSFTREYSANDILSFDQNNFINVNELIIYN